MLQIAVIKQQTKSILRFFRSRNNSISDSGTPIATDDISNLSANSSSDATVDVMGHSSGIYYYWACVVDIAGESNTANNCSTAIKITGPLPDLVISSFSATPTIISSGGVVNLSAIITNSGNATADTTTLRYHRSQSDNTSDSGTPLATDDISNLSAASSDNSSVSITGHSSGTMYYWACVADVSGESNTANNCFNNAIAITVGVPDLVISSFSATPTIISSDGAVNLSFTITNSGNGTADTTTLRYHRSQSDNTSDSGTPIATGDISRILAGDSNNVTADVTRHSSGTMYYWVCVGAVAGESTNNCSVPQAITIGVPDLVVDFTANSSTTTTDINSGGVVNLSAKVRNSGTFTANPTTLQYYRSQNNNINNFANNLVTTDSISRILANSSSDATAEVDGHGSGIYYYWACVVAVSDESDITNNCSESVAVTAIVGASWTEAIDGAGWDNRRDHSSVVFKNKIWVLGGNDGAYSSTENDVWSSVDGISWTEATDGSVRWTARRDHSSVVFEDKIWVLGGWDGDSYKNDVWFSDNGINWTEATDGSRRWDVRGKHSSVAFDNKIWVLGGQSLGGARYNDVWSSENGISWTKVKPSNNAGWSIRFDHSSVVFDNKMWVLGGSNLIRNFNDVWSSLDGTNWKRATSDAGWNIRQSHSSIVFDNKIWVLGGWRKNIASRNSDVWFSSNGTSWTEAKPDDNNGWNGRLSHTSIAFDNKIWVLGGDSYQGVRNDVWSSGINNNSFTNATSLNGLINAGLNSANNPVLVASHSATLTAGASDFYRISIPTPPNNLGNWIFETDGSTDTLCELYDNPQSQNPLRNDDDGADDNCSITRPINAMDGGDYYIKISGGGNNSNSVTGNYTLKITAP